MVWFRLGCPQNFFFSIFRLFEDCIFKKTKKKFWKFLADTLVQTIRARLDEVWTPELLIVNRLYDFPKVDENVPKCKKKTLEKS